MIEHWKLWNQRYKQRSETISVRYGVAAVFLLGATLVACLRPALGEFSYFLYFAAIILTAVFCGLAPSFVTIGISAIFIRLFFIQPQFSLFFGNNVAGMERMGIFILVSLLTSSLVAEIRREKNVLRDSEERYRILAETASDAIVVVNEKGNIIFVNPVAERLFGATGEQIVGQNLNTILPEKFYQSHFTRMKTHLDTRKKAVAMQLPLLRGTEHLLLEMTFGAFTKHGQNLFTAIIRDITGHKRPEGTHL